MLIRLVSGWRRYRVDGRGAAAVEFALMVTLLTVPLLNVIDAGFYVYYRMALDNAAQTGATAALAACGRSASLPATVGTNCSALMPAIDAAVQSTWLGTKIGLPTVYTTSAPASNVASVVEYYYCVKSTSGTSSNAALVQVGLVAKTAKPANCIAYGGSANDAAGDYIQVTLTYSFTPVIPGLSIVSGMSPIVRTAYLRLG